MLDERQLKPEDRARLAGELDEEKAKLTNLKEQSNLCKEKLNDLEVRSPASGIVVTWDVKNRLIRRPVQRGQTLLRVADPNGPCQLELHVPDDRMGFIAAAMEKLKKENEAKGEHRGLPVTYILATDPGTKHEGTVSEVYQSAEVHGEEGNTVLIKVKIDRNDLPKTMTAGATVTAKIYCGRRAVGFVLFHDLIAFIQSRILFRL